jgi:hypothetical protein
MIFCNYKQCESCLVSALACPSISSRESVIIIGAWGVPWHSVCICLVDTHLFHTTKFLKPKMHWCLSHITNTNVQKCNNHITCCCLLNTFALLNIVTISLQCIRCIGMAISELFSSHKDIEHTCCVWMTLIHVPQSFDICHHCDKNINDCCWPSKLTMAA